MGENYVRVGGRGTSRRIAKKEDDNWTGAEFKKSQETIFEKCAPQVNMSSNFFNFKQEAAVASNSQEMFNCIYNVSHRIIKKI